MGRGSGLVLPAVAVVAVLLVARTVATVNPLMNHWYFVGVRPAAMRGAAMPVPAGRRTEQAIPGDVLQGGHHLGHLGEDVAGMRVVPIEA